MLGIVLRGVSRRYPTRLRRCGITRQTCRCSRFPGADISGRDVHRHIRVRIAIGKSSHFRINSNN